MYVLVLHFHFYLTLLMVLLEVMFSNLLTVVIWGSLSLNGSLNLQNVKQKGFYA